MTANGKDKQTNGQTHFTVSIHTAGRMHSVGEGSGIYCIGTSAYGSCTKHRKGPLGLVMDDSRIRNRKSRFFLEI